MDRRIDFETARATLDDVFTAAADEGARVIVEREGHEPVVVVRLRDVDAAAALGLAVDGIRAESKARGLDTMSMDEIDAEIQAYRREKASSKAQA